MVCCAELMLCTLTVVRNCCTRLLQFCDEHNAQLVTPPVESIGSYQQGVSPSSNNESQSIGESENDDPVSDSSSDDSIKAVESEANTSLHPEEGLRRRSCISSELVTPANSACQQNHQLNMNAEKLPTEESTAGHPESTAGYPDPSLTYHTCNLPTNHLEPSHHQLPSSSCPLYNQSNLTVIINSLASPTSICEFRWDGCRFPSLVCLLVTLFLFLFLYLCYFCYCVCSILLQIFNNKN